LLFVKCDLFRHVSLSFGNANGANGEKARKIKVFCGSRFAPTPALEILAQ
jgi:hypothetical protein